MTPSVSAPAYMAVRRPIRVRRAVRRAVGWVILTGWIVLPLLPILGIALSSASGLGLF